MSKYRDLNDKLTGDYQSMVTPLQLIMNDRGDTFVSTEAAASIINNDGFSGITADNVKVEFNSLVSEINAIATEYAIELTPAQSEAGAITVMASKDPSSLPQCSRLTGKWSFRTWRTLR